MSYRLIDANAIAVQFPAVNYMPCIYADLDAGLDGRHYDLRDGSVIESENAKLREMCIDMASHLREAERIHEDKLLPDGYITCMRELGIEV